MTTKPALLVTREQVVSDTVAYLAKQRAADLETLTVEDDDDKAIAIVRGMPQRGIPALDWVEKVSQSAERANETGPTSGPVLGEGD